MLLNTVFYILLIQTQNVLVIARKIGTVCVSKLFGLPLINNGQWVKGDGGKGGLVVDFTYIMLFIPQ